DPMRRLWLLFAQAVTICLALLFTIATLKPNWLTHGPGQTTSTSVVPFFEVVPSPGDSPTSYAGASNKAAPAVVNIFTRQTRQPNQRPLVSDPFVRYFFGDEDQTQHRPAPSLGSGVIVSPEGYILPNNHVIEGADAIQVALADGRKA